VKTQVVVNSLAISKNSSKTDFQKYNIEVSLEEIENRVTSNKLNYGLTLLSNPKNVRISIEGTTSISGTERECIRALEKDENGIPRVLHLIYQDVFPTIFMTTKVVGAPCPAYRLSQVSAPSEIDSKTEERPELETTSEQPTDKAKPDQPELETTSEQPTDKAKPDQPELEDVSEHSPHILQPKYEAKPEQPEVEIAPAAPIASIEKKPEEMNLDELTQLYSNLGSEYQNNPSGEIGEKLQKVSELMQKHQQEQMVTESS
jgi:hypothetical protein